MDLAADGAVIEATWDDFAVLVQQLGDKLTPIMHEFDSICGVPRDGLVVAVYLANLLNKPIVNEPTSTTLVVDTNTITGASLQGFWPRWGTAVIFWHAIGGSPNPDFYVERMDDLVIFPWEVAPA